MEANPYPKDRDLSPTETSGILSQRPLVPLAIALCLGIAFQRAVQLPLLFWMVAITVVLLLAGGVWWLGVKPLLLPVITLTFACLGGYAMGQALFGQPANHVSRLPDAYLASPVFLEGWVVGPPDPRPADARDTGDPERTRFTVEVTRLRLGETWVAASGQVRLTVLGQVAEVAYGDEVRGVFRLRHPRRFENPGAFDYPAYLATQGIFLEGWTRDPVEILMASRGSKVFGFIFGLRTLILQRLDAVMPPAEAGLLKATVLGDRSGLTPEMNGAFLDSGTYHILAISGLNVSILAGFLFGLLRLLRVSPQFAALASAILVTLYAALAGGSASVIRAAVMADTYLLAVILDRRGDLVNTLALSALGLLWWNPRFLFDVGFQLTYLATLGILVALPRCESMLTRIPRAIRWALESIVITLAATLMILPVLASTFNRVSPVAPLANLPIVPLSGLITGLGTAACAILVVVPHGFAWLNALNGWLVNLLLWTAQWFAAWPLSTVRVYTPTPGMLIAYYGIVMAWILGISSPPMNSPVPSAGGRVSPRRWCGWLAVWCAILLLFQILFSLNPPEGIPRVQATVLDVGQGEAIFLTLPGKRRMLLDAGGVPGGQFDVGAQVVAPFLRHEWVGHLDALALTHAHEDHIGGIPAVLREFSVEEVWSADAPTRSITFLWVQEYLRHKRIPLRIVSSGTPAVQWGEATVQFWNPPDSRRQASGIERLQPLRPDDACLVLRISIGNQAILLTGDIEREGEAALLRHPGILHAQVLKVPHHGGRSSSGDEFIAAVRPEVALLSVGERNRFHHPHPEVVERYQRSGVRLLRTDRDGALSVELTPEGTRVWGRRGGELLPSGSGPDGAQP